MRPSSRDGFAIAIICALNLEAEAVEELFDETYDRLGGYYRKQPGDDNAYINGRIGNHNAVVCYMPGMGKEMQPADVIISDSVIQYDFGRQCPGGFERKTGVKGTLGRPNKEVRALLAGLQAKRTRRDLQAKMLRHLQAIQKSDLDEDRPSSADDVLFEASYQHKHYSPTSPMCRCLDDKSRDVCKAALDTACIHLGCDKNRVSRHRCDTENCSPSIHIGTVAFVDKVMKSGEHCDRLVKSDNVIRVCDYADSHKNKAWQAYAAATGAATAKAFLEYWVPAVREDDLTHLWGYLQPRSPQTRKVAVLHGLGGIDKTQLAISFARKYKDDFTAIFWLSGKDRSALIQSLSTCFPRILGHPVNNEVKNEEAEQRANQVLQWLAVPADHGSIIITSRVQRLSEVGKPFPINLGPRLTVVDIITIEDRLDGLSLAIEYLQLYKNMWSDLQSQATPTHIWYELIRGGLNYSHTPPWFEAAVSNKLAFKARIKVLVGFPLVETRQQVGNFTIHPVVQDWCFHIAASEKQTVQLYDNDTAFILYEYLLF
ncbi:nucleoside phosphorylase domain-containing protein [Aspergillus navahoensis]